MKNVVIEAKNLKALTTHDLNRQRIAQQVENFIKHGGEIETIEPPEYHPRPVAQGWRPKAGSFES